MIYSLENRTFTIHELIGNAKARNSFLAFAKRHLSEADKLVWKANENDKFYLQLKNQKYSGTLLPFMMARCIDVRAALEKLKNEEFTTDGAINILVKDKFIAENNFLFCLKVQDNKISVIPTFATEDIEMDVSVFTQIYFGAFLPSELYQENLIKSNNVTDIYFLDTIFPKCDNFINEYF